MFFAYIERLAIRIWPHRFRFLISGLLIFLIGVPAASVAGALLRVPTYVAVSPVLPMACMAWAAWCLTLWFHPERGVMRWRPRAWLIFKPMLMLLRLWGVIVLLGFCFGGFLPLLVAFARL